MGTVYRLGGTARNFAKFPKLFFLKGHYGASKTRRGTALNLRQNFSATSAAPPHWELRGPSPKSAVKRSEVPIMEVRRPPLLTGWSLVRIRPGEPATAKNRSA